MAEESRAPILKVRTFADDIKRVGGGTPETASSLNQSQESGILHEPLPAPHTVLKNKTPIPPHPPQSDGLYHPPASTSSDSDEEIRQSIGVATILNERPTRQQRSAISEIKKSIISWWDSLTFHQNEEKDPFAQSTYPAVPVAQNAPLSTNPPPQQDHRTEHLTQSAQRSTLAPEPSTQAVLPHKEFSPQPTYSKEQLAQSATSSSLIPEPPPKPAVPRETTEAIHVLPEPQKPLSLSPQPWRRISEPRENDPLSYTTEEELVKYKAILRAALPPISPTEKQSLKTSRPVRQPQIIISVAPEYIAAQSPTPATAEPMNSPEARLQRLVQAETQPQERLMRDIPFVPPQPLETPTSPLRTYRNDALTDIQDRNLSRQNIAAVERERSDSTGIPIHTPHTESSRLPFALAAVLVFLCVGITGTFWYMHRTKTPMTLSTTAFSSALFSADKTVDVPLGTERVTLLNALTKARSQTTLENSQVAQLRIVGTGPQGTSVDARSGEIMHILDPKAPNDFLRNLADKVMFGTTGTKQEPFMILKVSAYDIAFAGMLKWEAYLSIDLTPFFGDPIRRTYDSSSLTTDHTRPAHFTDEVIQNIDVRILYDAAGEERLAYAFVDQETIAITTSHASLLALIGRLR